MSETSDRMPPIAAEHLDPAQRAAAAELIAGPRKAVTGPFVALLRSPELMRRTTRRSTSRAYIHGPDPSASVAR